MYIYYSYYLRMNADIFEIQDFTEIEALLDEVPKGFGIYTRVDNSR